MTLEVLHADNHLLVVRKPACVPTVPDESGDESLLDRVPAERVIVISANPEPERYARCDVRRHFAKPLDLEDLARAVEGLVEQGRSESE